MFILVLNSDPFIIKYEIIKNKEKLCTKIHVGVICKILMKNGSPELYSAMDQNVKLWSFQHSFDKLQ